MQRNYRYRKNRKTDVGNPTPWMDKLIWLLTTILFASFFTQNVNVYGSLVLAGVTAIILLLMLMKNQWKIPVLLRPYHVRVLLFAGFCYLSAVWGQDAGAALSKGTTILSLFLCTYVLYWAYSRENGVKRLLDACMVGGYLVAVYTFVLHGLDTVLAILNAGTRLAAEFANSNSVGMCMAICLTITVFDVLNNGLKWWHLGALPTVVILAATASRTAMVEAALGIFLVVLFKSARSGKLSLKSIFRLVVAMAAVIAVLVVIAQLPVFSAVMKRMEGLMAGLSGEGAVDGSTQERQLYIQAGLRQFRNTPLFGIGIGSSHVITKMTTGHRTYLHNNFVELLACGGVLGFAVFYSMHAYLFVQLMKKRKEQDPLSEICMAILLIYLLTDYGTVSYYTKETYFLLVICFLQTERKWGENHELKENLPGRLEVSYKS